MEYNFCLLNVSWMMTTNVQSCTVCSLRSGRNAAQYCFSITWERYLETAPDGRMRHFRAKTQIYRNRSYLVGDVFNLETIDREWRILKVYHDNY